MGHNHTILIVDDEPGAHDTLEAFLSPENYDLHFASRGVEGLTKALALKPDLILLNIMMPGMNGYEVCQRLKADERTKDIPVIFTTTLTDQESRDIAFEVGGIDFWSWSLGWKELRARITHHLSSQNREK